MYGCLLAPHSHIAILATLDSSPNAGTTSKRKFPRDVWCRHVFDCAALWFLSRHFSRCEYKYACIELPRSIKIDACVHGCTGQTSGPNHGWPMPLQTGTNLKHPSCLPVHTIVDFCAALRSAYVCAHTPWSTESSVRCSCSVHDAIEVSTVP